MYKNILIATDGSGVSRRAITQGLVLAKAMGSEVTAVSVLDTRVLIGIPYLSTEARAFGDFLRKSNDAEKSHLRLEVDKLRRSENEWLQILVRILDHIFALHQAAMIIPYYPETNPGFVALAKRTVGEVLADTGA